MPDGFRVYVDPSRHSGKWLHMVIWITGLSASGKTTLCKALMKLLKPKLSSLALIEGEELRKVFGNDLGYTLEDRLIGAKRLQGLVQMLSQQDIPVITSCLIARQHILDWNRENLPDYFEIYLKMSLEVTLTRDPNGLYKMAREGNMKDVVGIDIDWHEPASPDMVIKTDTFRPPNDVARDVARRVPGLSKYLTEEEFQKLGIL